MKKFLLFLLIAFVACIKLEDIDFGPILKEMRDYRLANPQSPIPNPHNNKE